MNLKTISLSLEQVSSLVVAASALANLMQQIKDKDPDFWESIKTDFEGAVSVWQNLTGPRTEPVPVAVDYEPKPDSTEINETATPHGRDPESKEEPFKFDTADALKAGVHIQEPAH